MGERSRVPPGQTVTTKFPVLTYGIVPRFDPAAWTLQVFGEVGKPTELRHEDFLGLPRTVVTADFHCVTKWSRLDNVWEGVTTHEIRRITNLTKAARHVFVHCDGGYTTDMPVDVFFDDDVLLAFRHDGKDLTSEHGYPVRLVVPNRYGWKSAKWVRAIEVLARPQPGFWEVTGYHPDADPWMEHRSTE